MIEMLQIIREFCKKNSVDVEINFHGSIDYPAIIITMRNKLLCRSMAFTDFDLEILEKSGEFISLILNRMLADLIDATVELLEKMGDGTDE
jgi:hypothetical protein